MSQLDTGDDRCAGAVPPVPLVPRFARRLHELDPAQALPGHEAGEEALRLVSAALLTCADVITRARENGAERGIGLRGGTFTVAKRDGGHRLTLHEVRWTEDLATSGYIDLAEKGGGGRADLEVQTPEGAGELELTWPGGLSGARVSVRGALAGKAIAAEALAP
jgi:hypothetical protein